MSLEPTIIKQSVLVAVAAAVLTPAVNAGYALVLGRGQGIPLPEALGALQAGAPYLVLGLFLAAVGAILGARLAAYRPGPRPWLTGLVAGAGLALVVVIVGWLRGRLDVWLPPNTVMAVVGGGLGGWLAGQV